MDIIRSKSITNAVRTRKLQDAGFRVLRFWDNDVLTRPDAVLVRILSELGPFST